MICQAKQVLDETRNIMKKYKFFDLNALKPLEERLNILLNEEIESYETFNKSYTYVSKKITRVNTTVKRMVNSIQYRLN